MWLFLFFSPKEPPPPEPEWKDIPSDVSHLGNDNFKEFVKKKKHVLVMFYAPCKHVQLTIYGNMCNIVGIL